MTKINKIFIYSFLIILFFFNSNLHANLANELSDMIQNTLTNVTSANVYKTQAGGLATGGSLRVRLPYKNIQIASITPPKLKVGCGGIDFYWGAFSFINKQELTQLLQAISANAVGYAFEMAMEALCPTCNAVVKDLSSKINKLLGSLNNSCYMAKALVNSTVGALTSATEQQCERVGADEAAHPDRLSARLACVAEQGPNMQKVWNEFKNDVSSISGTVSTLESSTTNPETAASTKYTLPKVNIFGNIVMNILNKLNLTAEQKQLFMSVIGTCIFGKPDPNTGQISVKCYRPLIDLHTVVYGDSNTNTTNKVYQCQSIDGVSATFCLAVSESSNNYEPLYNSILDKLNDIKDKIRENNPPSNIPTLTDDEKNLVEIMPTPVIALLKTLKKESLSVFDAYSQYIIDNSAEYVAVYVGNFYINRIISMLRKYQLAVTTATGKDYIKTLIANAEKNRKLDFQAAIEKFKNMYSNIIVSQAIIHQLPDNFGKTRKTNVIK